MIVVDGDGGEQVGLQVLQGCGRATVRRAPYHGGRAGARPSRRQDGGSPYGRDKRGRSRCSVVDPVVAWPIPQRARRPLSQCGASGGRAAKMAALHTASPSGMIDMSAKRLYHTRALARIGVHAQT